MPDNFVDRRCTGFRWTLEGCKFRVFKYLPDGELKQLHDFSLDDPISFLAFPAELQILVQVPGETPVNLDYTDDGNLLEITDNAGVDLGFADFQAFIDALRQAEEDCGSVTVGGGGVELDTYDFALPWCDDNAGIITPFWRRYVSIDGVPTVQTFDSNGNVYAPTGTVVACGGGTNEDEVEKSGFMACATGGLVGVPDGTRMFVEVISNEDGTFDRYVGHPLLAGGSMVDPLTSANFEACVTNTPAVEVEQIIMCDDTADDGTNIVRYVRHTIYEVLTGTVVNTFDTSFDMTTPYVIQGADQNLKCADAPVIKTWTQCMVDTFNLGVGFPDQRTTFIRCFSLIDGQAQPAVLHFGLDGLPYAIQGIETACEEAEDFETSAAVFCATGGLPGVPDGTLIFVEAVFVAEVFDHFVGHPLNGAALIDPLLPANIEACPDFEIEQQRLCDDTLGDGTAIVQFIRHTVYDKLTGLVSGSFETTLDPNAPYTVQGIEGNCAELNASTSAAVVCATNGLVGVPDGTAIFLQSVFIGDTFDRFIGHPFNGAAAIDPITSANYEACPTLEVEQERICDDTLGDGTVVVQFIRHTVYDQASGAVLSSFETTLDPTTPYTVLGNEIDCVQPVDQRETEQRKFCDDTLGDGTVIVEFIRHTVYNNDGTVNNVFDTEFDMETAYAVSDENNVRCCCESKVTIECLQQVDGEEIITFMTNLSGNNAARDFPDATSLDAPVFNAPISGDYTGVHYNRTDRRVYGLKENGTDWQIAIWEYEVGGGAPTFISETSFAATDFVGALVGEDAAGLQTNGIKYNPVDGLYYVFFTENVNTARRTWYVNVDPSTGAISNETEFIMQRQVRPANVQPAYFAILENGNILISHFTNNGQGISGTLTAVSEYDLTGAFVQDFTDLHTNGFPIPTNVVWVGDSRIAVLAGSQPDHTVRIWDLETNTQVAESENITNDNTAISTFIDAVVQNLEFTKITTQNCYNNQLEVVHLDSEGNPADVTDIDLISCEAQGAGSIVAQTSTNGPVTDAGATRDLLQELTIINIGENDGVFDGNPLPPGVGVNLKAYVDPTTNQYRKVGEKAYDATGTVFYLSQTD